MHELLLLRHAKSRWDEPEAGDHDRDLTSRGERAAAAIGKFLRKSDLVPDLVLCSSARRARRTWQLVAEALRHDPPLKELRSLYLATPGRLLEIVRRQNPAVRRLLLVGHNPGMASLASRLAGEGEADELARMEEKFPTAALARLTFTGDGWREAGQGRFRLDRFVRPRDLD
ncbi:SixA phosphatase family protein [Marinimicrococcus flavescens]|uniref:Histidine phosphatase family protein n=1 Tax=Marinimicrococcus flavescens TaxID=3031815 RepID=A0AAP3XSC9_9PROT|nr:histidine phosphatase family protein [Marinimicrococcus flavescens]